MNRSSVKRVFLFFLIYLPAQYLLIGIAGVVWNEPWPAFALPGFKQIYITESKSQIKKPFFFVEPADQPDKRKEVSAVQLFDGIQISQLQGFLRIHFSEPKEYSNEVKQWLQHRIEQQYPEAENAGLKVIWKEITYQHSGNSTAVESEENIKEINIPFGN